MALAFVESKTGSGTNTPTVSTALTTSVVAGQLIVANIGNDSGVTTSVSAVTDNKGNTYTRVATPLAPSATLEQWYSVITTGGTGLQVSVAWNTGNTGQVSLEVQYFNGFTGTPTLDKVKGATGTSAAPNTGASAALTNANEIVVVGAVHDGVTSAYTLGSGYTNLGTVNVANAATAMESKIVSATTAVTGNFTIAASSIWAIQLATFYSNATTTTSNITKSSQYNLIGSAISGLSDNFNDNSLDAKWSKSFAADPTQVLEQNSRIEITHTAAPQYNALASTGIYNLTSGNFFVQIVDAGNQSLTSHEVFFGFTDDSAANNEILFDITGGNIYAFKKVSGTRTQIGTSIAYSTTTHVYFRIRESAGTTYWDTADASFTWTNRWSATNPIAVIAIRPIMQTGCYATEASSSYAYYDSFNITPATVTDISKSLAYAVKTTAKPTKSLKYTIKATGSAITKSARYTVLKTYSATKSLKYTVLKTISVTKSLKYATLTVPTALTKSTRYAIKKTIATTKSVKYTIKAPIAITKSLKYTLKTTPSAKTKGIIYAIKRTGNVAPAIVQQIQAADNTSATTTTITATTTGGNSLILLYASASGATGTMTAISDTSGNVWTLPDPPKGGISGITNTFIAAAYVHKAVNAGTITITNNSTAGRQVILLEVSGLANTTPDVATEDFTNATVTTTPASSSGTTTTINDFIVGFLNYPGSVQATLTSSGWNALTNPATSGSTHLTGAYRVGTAAGIEQAVFNLTTANRYGGGLLAFKAIAGTPPITKAVRYAIKNTASGITKSLRYAIKRPVVVTKTLKYTIKQTASGITKAAKYTIKTTAAITKSLAYVTRSGGVLLKSTKYTVKKPVTVTKSMRYAVKTMTAFAYQLKYTIKASHSVTKQLKYTVKNVSPLNKALKYSIKTSHNITRPLKYEIKLSIALSKSTHYAVKRSLGLFKTTKYAVTRPITSLTKLVTYSIVAARIVSKTMRYDIITNPSLVKSSRYAVTNKNIRYLALEYDTSTIPVRTNALVLQQTNRNLILDSAENDLPMRQIDTGIRLNGDRLNVVEIDQKSNSIMLQ